MKLAFSIMVTGTSGSGETCEELGANCRPYAWYFIASYDEVLDSSEMRKMRTGLNEDRFINLLKSRENYRMVFLPSVDIVTFSLTQAATSQTSLASFTGKKIRQNAVLGYSPDSESGRCH